MSDPFLLVARAMAIDGQTAKVVLALRSLGIEPVLLKGPSFADWLYDDGAPRGYVDTDLLISEKSTDITSRVLHELGFTRVPTGVGTETAATTWENPDAPGQVDLHTSLWLFRPPSDLWGLLMPHTRQLSVAGLPVLVMNDTAKTIHVVTHALQDAFADERANDDLRRAINRVSFATWAAALTLADEVGAGEAFRAGLLAVREAAELCAAIGLKDVEPPARLRFLLDGRNGEEMLHLLYRTSGIRNRVALMRAKLLPPLPYLRDTHAVGVCRPRASVLLYAHYWWNLVRRAPRGLRNLFRGSTTPRHLISLTTNE